jgi:acyl-CoA synthetase (AMP-forming)/AMP-acid ligase II
VAAYPDKTAVSDASGHSISYRELDDQAARLAAFWCAAGVGAGDVVTMHLPNWWHSAVVTLAAFKLGAVINPLPPTYGWKDLAFIMNKSRSKAVVVAGRFRSVDYTEHLAHCTRAADSTQHRGHRCWPGGLGCQLTRSCAAGS